jgi:hypothetical protein
MALELIFKYLPCFSSSRIRTNLSSGDGSLQIIIKIFLVIKNFIKIYKEKILNKIYKIILILSYFFYQYQKLYNLIS